MVIIYNFNKMMKIGNKIKGLRIENGLTIDQMADKAGVSPQTYRKYESDKTSPDLNQLELIASIFNKTILDLLPENILFNNNDQKGGIALAYQSTINQQSEKLIEQYDNRIKELKQSKNETSNRVNVLNANGVASEFTNYIKKRGSKNIRK